MPAAAPGGTGAAPVPDVSSCCCWAAVDPSCCRASPVAAPAAVAVADDCVVLFKRATADPVPLLPANVPAACCMLLVDSRPVRGTVELLLGWRVPAAVEVPAADPAGMLLPAVVEGLCEVLEVGRVVAERNVFSDAPSPFEVPSLPVGAPGCDILLPQVRVLLSLNAGCTTRTPYAVTLQTLLQRLQTEATSLPVACGMPYTALVAPLLPHCWG